MKKIKRQIIAIGGDTAVSLANSKRRENPTLTAKQYVKLLKKEDFELDQYVLDQTGKKNPRICFLATASGDNPAIYEGYYEVMKRFKCKPTHLSLYMGTDPDLRKQLLNQDLIYVCGGNTRNMLTLWKDWGVDQIIREAYQKGIVLAGWSAGSICWFEQGVTDSVPGSLTTLKCLGYLKGSNCPHYDGEEQRRPSYHRLLRTGKIKSGIAADDKVALHYINEKLTKVFSTSPTGKAYFVNRVKVRDKNVVVEEAIG